MLAAVTASGDETGDLRAARAVFEENIAAIRNKDRDQYISLYLNSDKLVRTGATGQ